MIYHSKRSIQRKRKLAKLHVKQNGRCRWCGRSTKLETFKPKRGLSAPDDLATIDHLIDRFDKPNRSRHGGVGNTVMACWRCNFERGRDKEASVPREELIRRSKLHQQKAPVRFHRPNRG